MKKLVEKFRLSPSKGNAFSLMTFLLFFLTGVSLSLYLYFPAFDSWYLREDSRFFSVAPFSLYDLYDAFATPFNSMGQYRPITKVLWSLPVWLGLPIPFSYHLISYGLLLLAGAALARIQYKIYPSIASSGLAFCLYLLLPIHQKIMYWISAWHNIAAAAFFFLCLALRMEIGREEKNWWPLRVVSLICLFLGFASREIVFAMVPLLVVVDYFYQGKSVKRSIDIILLTGFMVVYLFVFASPFQVARVKLAEESIYSISWVLHSLDMIFTNSLWSAGDAFHPILSPALKTVSYVLAAISILGLLFRRVFLIPLGLMSLGVAPFMAIGSLNLEYLVVFGGGLVLVLTISLALILEKVPRRIVGITALCLIFLPFAYTQQLLPTRQLYAGYYRVESHLLRDFVNAYGEFSQQTQPGRFIEIVDFGQYVESQANMSHHFLVLGLDHLVPKHFSLFRNEDLKMVDGTGLKDQIDARSYWKPVSPLLLPSIKARYRKGKFEVVND